MSKQVIFILASLLQLYVIPLAAIQIFLATDFSRKASVVLYTAAPGDFSGPEEVLDAYDVVSFMPGRNLIVMAMLIIANIRIIASGKDTINSILMAYEERTNPLMFRVTMNALKDMTEHHVIKFLKADEEGFVEKGWEGLVIREEDGKYVILVPFKAIVEMEKEDVKDVSIETIT